MFVYRLRTLIYKYYSINITIELLLTNIVYFLDIFFSNKRLHFLSAKKRFSWNNKIKHIEYFNQHNYLYYIACIIVKGKITVQIIILRKKNTIYNVGIITILFLTVIIFFFYITKIEKTSPQNTSALTIKSQMKMLQPIFLPNTQIQSLSTKHNWDQQNFIHTIYNNNMSK